MGHVVEFRTDLPPACKKSPSSVYLLESGGTAYFGGLWPCTSRCFSGFFEGFLLLLPSCLVAEAHASAIPWQELLQKESSRGPRRHCKPLGICKATSVRRCIWHRPFLSMLCWDVNLSGFISHSTGTKKNNSNMWFLLLDGADLAIAERTGGCRKLAAVITTTTYRSTKVVLSCMTRLCSWMASPKRDA